MRLLAGLMIAAVFAAPVLAQAQPRGIAVKAEFALDPAEIALGEEVTLTLTIRNTFNPQQLTRPDLQKLPEFAKGFVITDVPGDSPQPKAAMVKFVYKLRPRESGTIELPRLAFNYLSPQDKPNTTLTQKGLTITVKPAVVAPPPIVPVEGPEELFKLADMSHEPRSADVESLWWFLPLGPMLGLVWYLAWLRLYPDAAMQRKLRRNRAARRALRAIDAAEHSDDPGRALAAAIRQYLHDRCWLSADVVTADEVAEALSVFVGRVESSRPDAGWLDDANSNASDRCSSPLTGKDVGPRRLDPTYKIATIDFLHHCDAVRFSPAPDASLAAEARRLISMWEAE